MFTIGSKVRCIQKDVYYYDCEGIVIANTQGKKSATLSIRLTQTPVSRATGISVSHIIAKDQPVYWWEVKKE